VANCSKVVNSTKFLQQDVRHCANKVTKFQHMITNTGTDSLKQNAPGG